MIKRKGLIIVNTGEGKGKTTAALGIALRALGHGYKICIIQFIKGKWKPGEYKIASKLAPNYEIIPMGLGFTWLSKDLNLDKSMAQRAWNLAKEKIFSNNYNIIILDEITYPINFQWIDLKEVLETLKKKPEDLHIIITGRNAPKEIIDIADLVTEMKLIKHPYQKGIIAQRGIEF
ncbi:Cob(I)yrinic acid a,c-diamide adenosyltransferase [archaeon HR06]|nr:Cob(I)yrinic acid a,c-diamide adenosyltransferase [archaeon HR06]